MGTPRLHRSAMGYASVAVRARAWFFRTARSGALRLPLRRLFHGSFCWRAARVCTIGLGRSSPAHPYRRALPAVWRGSRALNRASVPQVRRANLIHHSSKGTRMGRAHVGRRLFGFALALSAFVVASGIIQLTCIGYEWLSPVSQQLDSWVVHHGPQWVARTGWLQRDARWILSAVMFRGAPFAAALLTYGATTRRRSPRSDNDTHCRKCAYILRGLSEPRCPECGERA